MKLPEEITPRSVLEYLIKVEEHLQKIEKHLGLEAQEDLELEKVRKNIKGGGD